MAELFDLVTLRDRPRYRLSQGEIIAIALPVIQQALSQLFQGANPGHYQGGRFIPGDLENRLATAAGRIQTFGVASVADQNIIYDILTEVPPQQFVNPDAPQWQITLDRYLGYLQKGVQNGTIIPGQVGNTLIKDGKSNVTGGGFVYNLATFGNLVPVVLIGGAFVYLIARPKRHKGGRK